MLVCECVLWGLHVCAGLCACVCVPLLGMCVCVLLIYLGHVECVPLISSLSLDGWMRERERVLGWPRRSDWEGRK